MDACSKASHNQLHKKIVDQIIAVDNFMAFKKLMIKRNQELNQQALLMLSGGAQKQPQSTPEEQPHKTPASASTAATAKNLTETEKQIVNNAKAEDEEMMRRAMEMSLQADMQKKMEMDEEEQMM